MLQAMELSPSRTNEVLWRMAEFAQSQFGVQTMSSYTGLWSRSGDDSKQESGIYAVNTLEDDETIAKLASGVKRFKLPDEYNHIKLWQRIAKNTAGGYTTQALDSLGQCYENRRQYEKAADVWRQAIKQGGKQFQDRLDQIVGNWGRFETAPMFPAGQGAKVEFRFRNAKKVHFEAHALHIDKLLGDVKAYLKSNPQNMDWNRIDISNIGYRLLHQNQTQYLGAKKAEWDLPLEPREHHYDKMVTVTTPLQQAGAYLLKAKVEGGNESFMVLWVSDLAIVKKPVANKPYYFVADAVTGSPIAKANVEFFGYRNRYLKDGGYTVDTLNFAEFTDANGQVSPELKDDYQQYNWIVTARTAQGQMAFMGFVNVWAAGYHDSEYNDIKTFGITDRPVYRPEQAVQFKFWIGRGQYDQPEKSQFANQQFTVQIYDPRGEVMGTKSYKSDSYAGFDGQFELPADAMLGQYSIMVAGYGGMSFRVEEYKKPEFEVTVEAPKEPIMLGEQITATIEAKYYFGSPVSNAKVKYKVYRTGSSETWYPIARWDWCFGPGYWWYAYDCRWLPGWNDWGCPRPMGWWWGQTQTPPELVAEVETDLPADGILPVPIDTRLAQAIHGDLDHTYRIVAEVTDQSRRTIVGEGNVMVARKPFQVYAWVDRGYYHAGDDIQAHFNAHTLDQKPVKGTGELQLIKITYDAKNQPVETVAETWKLDTDAQGESRQQMKAAQPGQYRLSYRVTDAEKHSIEGGYVFTVIGQAFDGSQYRFNDLELINDRQEYAPGDKVKLQINTNRLNSTVLLFVRAANGAYLPPKILHLKGKSTVEEIDVLKKDMPNFFIEAVTVANGKVHTETKEIIVPPENRVFNVEVEPNAATYKPGEAGTVKLKLTYPDGKPVVGSAVLTMYDKSVEYVSGGSNVPEIQSFFWKWRRSHQPQTEYNLSWITYNLLKPNQVPMSDLGVFGNSVADWAQSGRVQELAEGAPADEMLSADAAMPMSPVPTNAPAAQEKGRREIATGGIGLAGGPGGGQGQAPAMVQPTVRKNFADTAKWVAALTTDADGTASIKMDMPENLTTWIVRVWGMSSGSRVGQGQAEVVTRKDLIVRLQAPRFFVEKDEVILSANVHNYLKDAKQAQVVLELVGGTLKPLGETTVSINLPAGGEQRVDFRVQAIAEGEAVIRMKALTDVESDAMEMRFPVFVHGMLKTESFSGVVRPDEQKSQIAFRVPKERRINESRLEVRYSPTLAGAMVDALPYLADYPYGCTEQTLSRFLPTVITQKILQEMQLDLKAIRDKRTNLNAQEIGDDVKRAKDWKRFEPNPVFDEAEVQKMVKAGVQRLTNMQLSDGGWGWFSGYGEYSYPHTTAYVVHGLQMAQQNDVALVPGMLDNGVAWLQRYQQEQIVRLKNAPTKKQPYKVYADDLDAFVYMVLVDANKPNQEMMDFLYRDRTHLAVYTKAMFGLALHKQKQQEKLDMILRNISQFVVEDDENQTAYLRLPADHYWYWYGSEYEAHAYYLKLLSRTDAKGRVASRLVKYLLNNRKHSTYWNSTRDTALCIEALADYLKASGENKPNMTVEVWLDGKKEKEVQITAADLFTFDNKFVLFGDAVTDGDHKLEIRRTGEGPVYFNAYLTNFTLEDPITKAGLEIKVQRKFYELVPVKKSIKVAGAHGQAVDQNVEKFERKPLENLSTLKSGSLVEVELEIDSKNDYEYLIFEDMKAAGFEPVEVRSGYNGNDIGAYVEFRDERVSFFVYRLARGKHSVSYRLRAEIPGRFSALPAKGSAMYAPELKANSDELKLQIED